MATPSDRKPRPDALDTDRARMIAFAIAQARTVVEIDSLRAFDEDDGRAVDILVKIDFLREHGMLSPASLDDPASALRVELAELVLRARHDRAAWRTLAAIASDWLQTGQDMPHLLRAFVTDVLACRLPCPPPRGRPPRSALRDDAIALMIAGIARTFTLAPTRNDATDHRLSACDIAAEAMRSLRLAPASYAALKRIWLRRAPDLR